MLAHKSVNIATMQLYRERRGEYAVMVIETDQPIPDNAIVAMLTDLCASMDVTSAMQWHYPGHVAEVTSMLI